MLLDDAVRQRQAEAEAARLRGHERIEDAIEQLGGNALALVRNLDLDQRPGAGARVDAAAEQGVERQARGQREPATPFWTRFWNTCMRRSASAQRAGKLGS
jgi:hypothetical protein